MTLAVATLQNISISPAPPAVQVQFNPTEYGIDRGATYAELQVPGLQMPLLQFVRGDAQTLSLELFLDGTDKRGSATPEQSVAGRLAALRAFVTVHAELHAPPVCRFTWGEVEFTGVVTQLRERYTLFSDTGAVMRARVTTTFKSYQAPEVQLREMGLHSPDRTKVRVLRDGETLTQLAREAYGDPRLWRAIASENDIDRPRFVPSGTALRIPSL
jgi:hypothetical protein